MRIGSILLAAGGSTRLGSPKQLLVYEGQSLLQRAATTLLSTECRPCVAVVGSRADKIRAELAGYDVSVMENTQWQRGMGSSLRLGLETLVATSVDFALEAVLLTLCDQPLILPAQLHSLLNAFKSAPDSALALASAAYSGTVGVPAIFGSAHFAELLALPDGAGARQVLIAHRTELIEVAMPEAALDIDTREQYQHLTDQSQPDDRVFAPE